MQRRISIVLLAVFFSVFFLQNMVFAETTSSSDTSLLVPSGATQVSGDGKLFSDEKLAQMKKDKDDASLTDGIMLGFILSIFKAVNISSLPTLIFGNPYGDSGTLNYGIFSQGEMDKIINPLLGMLTGLYALILTGAIMVSSAKFGLKAYSPQAKADFWTDINMWVLSAFFMGSFWLIFKVMMSVNLSFVSTMYDTLISTGVNTNGISLIASAGNFNLGNALVYLAEFGLTLYLNVIYIARKVIIIFLVVLSPFAAYSLIFPKTRAFFGTWLKELAGNIFLQSVHAITIFVFAELSSLVGGGTSGVYATIYRLGLLIMFIPITGMISRWLNLGDSSTKLGQTATLMGASSIAGAMMLAKGAGSMLGGRRAGSALINSGSDMGGTASNAAADFGHDGGTTALSTVAKGGAGWHRFKSIAGGVAAVAGGTMGLTMGPAGVAAGAKLGSVTVQGGMQVARNASAGMLQSIRTFKSGFSQTNSSSNENTPVGFWNKLKNLSFSGPRNFSNMWSDLGERRRFMGEMGESLGSIVGAGKFGRSMGHMLSGASRNRVQKESRYGSDQSTNLSLPQLATMHAGKSATWEQTNLGSAFYVQTSSGKKRISNYGAADPSLKNNEVRVVDYKFPSMNEKYERQPNGTYKLSGSTGVGLNGGSTEYMARTSEAYIQGADGSRYVDHRMDASRITPDSYYSHHILGVDRRSPTDKGADIISRKRKEFKRDYTRSKQKSSIADQAMREKNRVKNNGML